MCCSDRRRRCGWSCVFVDPAENIRDVLGCICEEGGLSESKRLNYLNAFVKLTLHINGNFTEHGYSVEEVLCW